MWSVLYTAVALWEDHYLKPSTCPHGAEMGALREAARDNTLDSLMKYVHRSLKVLQNQSESTTRKS